MNSLFSEFFREFPGVVFGVFEASCRVSGGMLVGRSGGVFVVLMVVLVAPGVVFLVLVVVVTCHYFYYH